MTKLKAELIGVTKLLKELEEDTPEGLVAYCARVSNPQHQDKPIGSLFDYCIRNKHWSIFEMANALVEVEAPRDISRQLLRHRSFSFQEFSQRYSDQIEFTDRELRRQDSKNRQNSIDDFDEEEKAQFKKGVEATSKELGAVYRGLLDIGAAKECARVILPEGLTMSRLYVNGTLRSWLHYLDVRDDPGVTQWEHVLLAREIRKVLEPAFPKVFSSLIGKCT